ncbi:MAG: hypothetical protein IT372_00780 [Polyangiaceae bacterium]|nr:hypothetical protein [Polyangiaceae bacterium]
MRPDAPRFRSGRGLLGASVTLSLFGVLALALGAAIEPRRWFFSYLAAYAYVLTTALGALIFLMTCHAMRASWPAVVRRLTESIVGANPLLVVLFVPLLFGLDRLYPWLDPDRILDEESRAIVHHQAPYLNLPFFLARAAAYFIVWIVAGALLRRWSAAQDEGRAPRAAALSARMRALSAGMLPPVGIALSFAAIDWLMTLEPGWTSTMFPVRIFAGGFVAAIALLTLLAYAADRAALVPGLNESHYYALGRLLLAFVIFWAYTAYFELFLIWIANRPDDVQFHARRLRGPAGAEGGVLVFAHFVIPFLILLSYRVKRRPAWLAAVAAWILAAHYIDVHWIVLPVLEAGGLPYHWLDVGALLALGGAATAFAALRLRGKPALAVGAPELERALRYDSQ